MDTTTCRRHRSAETASLVEPGLQPCPTWIPCLVGRHPSADRVTCGAGTSVPADSLRLPLQCVVRLFVEPEDRAILQHEDWPFDQVRLLEHQRDGLPLRRGQRALPEHGAAPADVLAEVRLVDVLFEKRARRRRPVDVPLLDFDPAPCQMTSGVLARGSGRLPVEDRLRHKDILAAGGWRLAPCRAQRPPPTAHGPAHPRRPRPLNARRPPSPLDAQLASNKTLVRDSSFPLAVSWP
jgi:hypothetical protein